LVQDSSDNHEFKYGTPGFQMSFSAWSPPQIDPAALNILAYNQIQSLYSLIKSRDPRQSETTSLLHYCYFRLFGYYSHSDWGNPQLVEISRRVSDWPCIAIISTANGFFRVICRRQDPSEWFWALEWNKFFRVAGMLTHPDKEPELLTNLPELQWVALTPTDRMRTEVPLADEDDILFVGNVLTGSETSLFQWPC
jgi:hypothetical protein